LSKFVAQQPQPEPIPIPHEPLWRVRNWFPELDHEKLAQLRIFHLELLRLNKSMNLISRRTESSADLYHIADGIIATRYVFGVSSAPTIFDIGSGNGIPGLILATLAPDRQIVCVDSNGKKAEAIRHFSTKMGLKNVAVGQTRLEDMKEGIIECAISRGFASIAKTLLLARKPMAPTGVYFHMKGTSWVREVGEIPSQIFSYWSPKLVADYYLPEEGHQLSLVVTNRIS
jgi:16S rRNA (guanine527-N7)-methyltransferase